MDQPCWTIRSQEGGLITITSLFPRTYATQTRKLFIVMGSLSGSQHKDDILAIYSSEVELNKVLSNFNRWLRERDSEKEPPIFTLPQDRESQPLMEDK